MSTIHIALIHPPSMASQPVHGGASTGPRTPEGLERSRRARWKHGRYSREAKTERQRVRAAVLAIRWLSMMERLGIKIV